MISRISSDNRASLGISLLASDVDLLERADVVSLRPQPESRCHPTIYAAWLVLIDKFLQEKPPRTLSVELCRMVVDILQSDTDSLLFQALSALDDRRSAQLANMDDSFPLAVKALCNHPEGRIRLKAAQILSDHFPLLPPSSDDGPMWSMVFRSVDVNPSANSFLQLLPHLGRKSSDPRPCSRIRVPLVPENHAGQVPASHRTTLSASVECL